MKPYLYHGRLSPALRRHVLEHAREFQKTMRLSVEAFGGRLVRCHLSAAGSDPIGFLDFPDDLSARAWNTFYGGQDGVRASRIQRLLDDDDLGRMRSMLGDCAKAATGHR